MLLGVAAVLTISATLGSVVGTSVEPQNALTSFSAPIASVPLTGPEISSPNEFVQGQQLLQQFSSLAAADLSSFVAANPAAVSELLATPPSATVVTGWWQSLDPSEKRAMSLATPSLVGNLDGIPFDMRDMANRSLLGSTMTALEERIADESGRTIVENARQQLHMLQSIEDALEPDEGQDRRQLMTLDTTGQGRAAIVIGNVRTADFVSYLVPGMFFTIENQMGDWADAAALLHDEQVSWLDYFADRDPGMRGKTVATVAWIGYHTPNLTNVGGIDNATAGSGSLASAIAGLQSLRSADEPYVSVVAHSYGTTTALMALTGLGVEIDALSVVGSPGSGAQSVSELSVRGGNVYVGEAPWDPVPNSAFFGSDPGAESYGAKKLGVDGGVDPLTGKDLFASNGHNEYLSPGTESMRNLALIGIGKSLFVMNDSSQFLAKAYTPLVE